MWGVAGTVAAGAAAAAAAAAAAVGAAVVAVAVAAAAGSVAPRGSGSHASCIRSAKRAYMQVGRVSSKLARFTWCVIPANGLTCVGRTYLLTHSFTHLRLYAC